MAGRAALILGTLFMGCCAILFGVLAPFIVGLYIQDDIVSPMAIKLLWIAAIFQLSDGIQCVGLGVLRGIQDTKMPTAITIVAYWVIGIPIGWYLGFHTSWSLYGIWAALLIGLTYSAIALSRRFIIKSRNLDLQYHSPLT
jgi:MATE family multidrug resistance protein